MTRSVSRIDRRMRDSTEANPRDRSRVQTRRGIDSGAMHGLRSLSARKRVYGDHAAPVNRKNETFCTTFTKSPMFASSADTDPNQFAYSPPRAAAAAANSVRLRFV
jgi:hypothetical protein